MRPLSIGVQAVQQNSDGTYEEAVRTLNTLQSNAAYIEKTKTERDRRRHLSLPETIETAKRVGISLSDIDALSVIHLSGTKGKGSTCAFTESILRANGYKTGFFSSPHLVEVRERLRINGRPISRDAFSTYFWECYKRLDATKELYRGDMPAYFRFLTIMACHVFIKEKVDVAILEVGIGGEYDCTNIVRNPVVCGVTSLGIDHTSLLGSTLDEIAWHKAGILKPGVPAVTVPQPEGSVRVIHDRAYEKGCPLYETSESIFEYDWDGHQMELGIPGEKQDLNAALATQLCDIWIKNHTKDIATRRQEYAEYWDHDVSKSAYLQTAPQLTLSEATRKGLAECSWPGRCQTLRHPRVTYFLDGAHTPRSIEVCAHWFMEASQADAKTKSGKIVTVLVFNATGDRQPESLLEHLTGCHFDAAVFCPNIVSTISHNKGDQMNYMVTSETQLTKSRHNQQAWLRLNQTKPKHMVNHTVNHAVNQEDKDAVKRQVTSTQNGQLDDCDSTLLDHQSLDREVSRSPDREVSQSLDRRVSQSPDRKVPRSDSPITSNGKVGLEFEQKLSCNNNRSVDKHMCSESFGSILESLHWITQGKDLNLPQIPINVPTAKMLREADHIQVLCTGSLHLVGGILGLLQPDVCNK